HLLASDAVELLLEAAEVAEDVRTPKLVVERRGADRSFEHDRQRALDAVRLAVVLLPGADVARDTQVGDRESDEAGLGLAAATGRALVADLTARTGGSASER